jgi:hypothetical protein
MARPKKSEQPDKTQFVAETFESPVDVKRHDVPERHAFGEAFLAPADADVSPTGPAPQTGAAGKSEKFARADHIHAYAGGGGTGGVSAHNQLTGLAVGDDHPQYTLTAEADAIAAAAVNTHEGKADPHAQYLTAAEGDALFLTPAEGNAAYESKGVAAAGDSAHVAAADPHTQYLRVPEIVAGTNVVLDTVTTPGSVIIGATPGGSGVTDHGLLTGLADDDHPQYHNNARGDARYEAAGSVAAHAAAADPHPTYLTAAEGDAAYVNVGGDAMTGALTTTSSIQASSSITSLLHIRGVRNRPNRTWDNAQCRLEGEAGQGSVITFFSGAYAPCIGSFGSNTVYVTDSGGTTLGYLTVTPTSSSRFKRRITNLGSVLDRVLRTRVRRYHRESSGRTEYGLIEEEASTVLHEIFETHPNMGENIVTLNTNSYVAILHKAIQELAERVATLEARPT